MTARVYWLRVAEAAPTESVRVYWLRVGAGASAVTGGGGGIRHKPHRRLWWLRKPASLDEDQAEEALEQAEDAIATAVAKARAVDATPEQTKKAAKEAVAPLVRAMPGFDWTALYRQAEIAAKQAAQLEALNQAVIKARIFEAFRAYEAQIQQDEEDIELLALML